VATTVSILLSASPGRSVCDLPPQGLLLLGIQVRTDLVLVVRLQIEEVDPSEAMTPRVWEIHREQLAKREAERGEDVWMLNNA
jgi:hypothetical protein